MGVAETKVIIDDRAKEGVGQKGSLKDCLGIVRGFEDRMDQHKEFILALGKECSYDLCLGTINNAATDVASLLNAHVVLATSRALNTLRRRTTALAKVSNNTASD